MTCAQVCRLARLFDPAFASQHLTPGMVNDLANIKPIMNHLDIQQLHAELPAYLAAATTQAVHHNMDDVVGYTESVLHFWRSTSDKSMRTWRLAARIMFGMSPNSASCERVFAMLASMFGEEQKATLADVLQASLLLRINRVKREAS